MIVASIAIKRKIINLLCQLLGLKNPADLQAELKRTTEQVQQLERQQKTLYRVISKIRASLDLETIFRTATQETCKLLNVERISVYQFDENWGGKFISDFEFLRGNVAEIDSLGKNTVWNDTYLQECRGGRYQQNETFAVDDVLLSGLSQCHLDILDQFHIRAYATAPIFTGQKLWGVLAAYQHSSPHRWQSLEIDFLARVATQLGFAVQQAEFLTQTQQKARDLEEADRQKKILFNLIAEIRESLDLDTLFNTTAREVRKALNADRVGVFRFHEGTNYYYGEFVSESVIPSYDSVLTNKVHDKCFGDRYSELYRQGRSQVISNLDGLRDCHAEILRRFQIKAQIITPLIQGENLWGLLCIHQCDRQREWTESEVQFVRQIATQFGVALRHSELLAQTRSQAEQLTAAIDALQVANMKLEKLASLDALTQVNNRRSFDDYLKQEWTKMRDERNFISLILLDIDYFKFYNDAYGHQAGDECLTNIARAVNAALKRSEDLLARYGGEEFAVILPSTNRDGAIEVARHIQEAVKNLNIPHFKSPSSQSTVTVSLGIASQIPAFHETPEMLIAKADRALYEAKEKGRDTWVVHS